MGPFKNTINTLLTTPLPTFNFLPIVGNIQNSLQQIQEDLSKSEPTSLPGEYNFDDTYTDEEISKALIESGKAAIEIGKAGIEIGKVGIEVGIEVGTVLIGAGIVFGKAGIGAGIGAGNAAIEVGKAGIVWFNGT